MQVKLLRALQESEFERVGGIKTTRVDVRLIAATNRDLNTEIEAGRFRKDLYYRLAVVPIVLPPLRERPSDIPTLVRHFIEKYNRRLNKKIEGIDRRGARPAPGLRLARQHPGAGEPDRAHPPLRRRPADHRWPICLDSRSPGTATPLPGPAPAAGHPVPGGEPG